MQKVLNQFFQLAKKTHIFCSEKKKKANPCIGAAPPQHSPSAMGRQKKWPPHNGSHLPMYQALASISGDDKIFGTILESTVSNLTSFGDGDAREAGTIRESPVLNLRYRWGNRDISEAGATTESTFSNLCYRWRDGCVLTSSYKRVALCMYYGVTVLA